MCVKLMYSARLPVLCRIPSILTAARRWRRRRRLRRRHCCKKGISRVPRMLTGRRWRCWRRWRRGWMRIRRLLGLLLVMPCVPCDAGRCGCLAASTQNDVSECALVSSLAVALGKERTRAPSQARRIRCLQTQLFTPHLASRSSRGGDSACRHDLEPCVLIALMHCADDLHKRPTAIQVGQTLAADLELQPQRCRRISRHCRLGCLGRLPRRLLLDRDELLIVRVHGAHALLRMLRFKIGAHRPPLRR